MQTQHTPGPWTYKGKETAGAGGLLLGRDGEPIAVVYGEKTNPRAEHDGNIMEAAPDLLEALEAANAQMRIAYECVEAGRYDEALLHLGSMPRQRTEAIAKARGTPC